jgi:hypothetical protein
LECPRLAAQWPPHWPKAKKANASEVGPAWPRKSHATARSLPNHGPRNSRALPVGPAIPHRYIRAGVGLVARYSCNAPFGGHYVRMAVDEHGLTSISTGFGFCHEFCQRFGKTRAKSGYARPSRTGQISVRSMLLTPPRQDMASAFWGQK